MTGSTITETPSPLDHFTATPPLERHLFTALSTDVMDGSSSTKPSDGRYLCSPLPLGSRSPCSRACLFYSSQVSTIRSTSNDPVISTGYSYMLCRAMQCTCYAGQCSAELLMLLTTGYRPKAFAVLLMARPFTRSQGSRDQTGRHGRMSCCAWACTHRHTRART